MGQKNSGWEDPIFVGNRIMFVSRYGATEIYSMNTDGTDVMQVTNNIYKDAFEMSID